MKRDGSGMEQKKYILLDVGGTEIKGNVSDRNGVRTKIRKFPAQAQKSTEKILDNFAKICRELMREADGSVVGVGMAIPGPFDYENGISRICCFCADRLQKVFPGLEKNWKESARKERFGFR